VNNLAEQPPSQIVPITRDYLVANLERFYTVESEILAAEPEIESWVTPWDENAFLRDVPGKWQVSQAVEINEEIVGFLFASLHNMSDGNVCVHSHRVEVLKQVRSNQLAIQLWNAVFDASRAAGATWYTGFLMENVPEILRTWYQRTFGFSIVLDQDEISSFLGAFPADAVLEDNGCLQYENGTRKFLMVMPLDSSDADPARSKHRERIHTLYPTSRTSIHLFSSDPTALRLLDLLPWDQEVTAVILPSNRRGSNKVDMLSQQATRLGLSVYEHRVHKPLPSYLPTAHAGICWMYPQIIMEEDFSRYARGILNNHMGLLPEYRGFHILQWNIVSGETEAWSTWHGISAVVDGGPIWKESSVAIDQGITAWDLRSRVIQEGIHTFPSAWQNFYARDVSPRIPQVEQGHWWRPRTPEDSCLKPGSTRAQVNNIIRASCPPWPRAFVDQDGTHVYVQRIVDHAEPATIPYETSDMGIVHLAPLENS
jgi:methionyl-tRNA formyltransferase/UDP-4-amino-4-deoxy-L-arabinose formyltransferase/UDP-glucuronic acid dehydrogenase (UDP-4-keto-hexauronic acid decarboxylating)